MNIFFKEFHEDNMIKIVIAGMEELQDFVYLPSVQLTAIPSQPAEWYSIHIQQR
jgi:hypothetical protein